jgi:2-polyprenyl-3-methyl-5-hydroxy-6-metoxy-1,4-benzoquinol methylase
MVDAVMRQLWTEVITAEDFDQHMHEVAQAPVNAELTREMLLSCVLPRQARILIVGAGTGQMFDYVSPEFLSEFDLTFSDINPRFLTVLERRLRGARLNYRTLVDDIERTNLPSGYDAALAVLVLEHVDWRAALKNLARLDPMLMYFIIQHNPPSLSHSLGIGRPLNPSMQALATRGRSKLVPEQDLCQLAAELQYRLLRRYEREVLDGKRMLGLIFGRVPGRASQRASPRP